MLDLKKKRRFLAVSACLVAAFLSGCQYVDRSRPTHWSLSRTMAEIPVIETVSSIESDWESMVAAAAEADVVLVGEVHGDPRGIAATGALWQELTSRADDAALAWEMLERDEQVFIDDFLAGLTSERELMTSPAHLAVKGDHRKAVQWAKASGRRVIAANAPRRYVKFIRQWGYEAVDTLTETQRATFVLPTHQPNNAYRDRFDEAMAKHTGGPGETKADYYRAQLVWDATMADAVSRTLDDGHRPVMLIVGRFHVANDGGLTQMLRARQPDAKIVTIAQWHSDRPDEPMDAEMGDWVLDIAKPDPPDPEAEAAVDPSSESAEPSEEDTAGGGVDEELESLEAVLD